MSLRMLLIGPQGSGKGSVASVLKEDYSIPHISMGDLLRDTVKSGSSLGDTIQSYINKGELVPLELIGKMLKERLSDSDCEKGFLLDGFPRSKEQAEVLDSVLDIDCAIVLDASKEVSLSRLAGRIQCRACNSIYNLNSKKPQVEGVCDECGGELYQREDDKGEAILKRLSIYESETKPVIKRYESKVVYIDTSSLELAEMVAKLREKLKKIVS